MRTNLVGQASLLDPPCRTSKDACPTKSARLLALAAFLACLLGAGLAGAGADGPDPLPLRRVLLPPDQLAQELKKVGEGVLLRLPQDEFEGLVRSAAKARRLKPPRLLEARYRAGLTEGGLAGTLWWKVEHAGPVPALLDVQPFNLALRQPRYENREAVLAEFEGRGLALLIDQPGEHALSADWSARTEQRPDAWQADLRFPPCPLSTLELDLPGDRLVSSLDGALLSGPHPSESAERKVWRVVCSNRDRVQLLIRRSSGSSAPLLFAHQKNTQRLDPDGAVALYQLDIEARGQGVRELVCEIDPTLRPIEVDAPGLESWTPRPPARLGQPATLAVKLRQPLLEGSVTVRCLGPLGPPDRPTGAPVTWSSPALKLLGAVPRGEHLELWLHPDLAVGALALNGFRLSNSTSAADPDSASRSQGPPGQLLTLLGGGIADKLRPTVSVKPFAVEFRARQLAWWRLLPGGMDLTLQIDYDVTQGQLFQLPVQLPPGWEVAGVDARPAGLLRNWTTREDRDRKLLLVDLSRPLRAEAKKPPGTTPKAPSVPLPPEADSGAGKKPALVVRLLPANPGPLVGRDFPFPQADVPGARFREGALGIEYDETVNEAVLNTTAAPRGDNDPEPDAPWGQQAPDFYFPYQGEPPTGTLRLTARPPRLRARCHNEVFVASGRAAVESHLILEAEGGSPDTVDLLVSAGGGEPWVWRRQRGATVSNRVQKVERLVATEATSAFAALAARTPLGLLVLRAAAPPGERWRLVLERPLAVRAPLTLTATRKLEPVPHAPGTPPRWEVPLVSVLGATHALEGEVTLHLAGGDLVQVETAGLREVRAPEGARSRGAPGGAGRLRPRPWRSYRYSQPGVSLVLQGQAPAGNGSPLSRSAGAVSQAVLTSTLTQDGTLRHHASFSVSGWEQRTFAVRLPRGAALERVALDGHWLDRLVDARRQEGLAAEGAGETPLELPIPSGGREHRYDLVYTTVAGPLGILPTTLRAPAPDLPVDRAAAEVHRVEFRRRWRLPPGTSPLSSAGLHALPGDAGRQRRGLGDLFRLLPGLEDVLERDDTAPSRRALADAVAQVRSARAGKELTLGQLVGELAFGYLKAAHPLVIDATALGGAGVRPSRTLSLHAPAGPEDEKVPWEEVGLEAVAGRRVIVLTTRRQGALWRGEGAGLPGPREEEAHTAFRQEQDPSGRFQSALAWLESEEGPHRPLRESGAGWYSWRDWEPVPGYPTPANGAAEAEGAELKVVRQTIVDGAGLLLGAFLALALGLQVRTGKGGYTFLLLAAWLLTAGLAVTWLPDGLTSLAWWPLALGLVVGLSLFVRRALALSRVRLVREARSPSTNRLPAEAGRTGEGSRPSHRTGSNGAAGALGALLLALGLLALGGHSAGQAAKSPAETVYVVEGERGERDRSVLVPPSLVERLKELARPVWAPAEQVVLTGADYDGKLVSEGAEFSATFAVHALGEGPLTLAVPLGGGAEVVGDILLDGARAFPVALPPGSPGFALKVKGQGRHKVELRFRVPLGLPDGDERSVRFTAPRLAQSKLTFRLPPRSIYPQVAVKHGGQRVVEDRPGAPRLEADLGAMSAPVVVRWWKEPRPARVEFREAYLWDLQPDQPALKCFLAYNVTGSAVTHLALDLPADLEVRSAEARRPAGTARPGDPGVRLGGCHVKESKGDPGRTLEVEFIAPVSGPVEVHLELVPRSPLPGSLSLPLPRPHGQPLGASHLAYRARGVEVVLTDWLRVTGVRPADFAPFWPSASRPDPKSLAYAVTFPRDPKNPPELKMRLRPLRARARVQQTVDLRVGARQAEVRVRVEAEAPGKDLAVLEWEVIDPRPLTLASVTGPGVRRWVQSPGRLLVWLERPTGKLALELAGWVAVEEGKGKPAKEGTLELPCLRPLFASDVQAHVRLRAAPGQAVIPAGVRGMQPREPGARASEQNLAYESKQPVQGGTFLVRPGAPPVVRVLTLAEVRDRQLHFTAWVEYRPVRGELQEVVVRLRGWEGEVIRLEAPPRTIARPREQAQVRGGQRERTWILDLSPGVTGPYRLSLSGSVPLEELPGAPLLPDVSVPGLEAERWVAVRGEGVEETAGVEVLPEGARGDRDRGEGARGDRDRLDGPALGQTWPDVAARLRGPGVRLWRVTHPDWQVRIAPGAQGGQEDEVTALLVERSAWVTGRSWQHEVVLALRQPAQADLTVMWVNQPARVTGVMVDGVEMAVLQPDPYRLWLPLPGRGGLRWLRLRWQNEEGEQLDRPDLEVPRLEGVRLSSVSQAQVWTVRVPPGWAVPPDQLAGSALGADRVLAVELARARAHLEASRTLAAGSEAQAVLRQEQSAFYQSLRRAEQALAQGADPAAVRGPKGEGAARLLHALREENLTEAKRSKFEAVRAAAEAEPSAVPCEGGGAGLGEGTPVSWLGEEPPRVRLVPEDHRQLQVGVAQTGAWLGLLALASLVAASSLLRRMALRLWPEVLAGLGALGWSLAGPTGVVLGLLLLGLTGRGLLLVRGLRSWLRPARRVA